MDNGALAEAALDEDEIEANLCGSFPAASYAKSRHQLIALPVREHPLIN